VAPARDAPRAGTFPRAILPRRASSPCSRRWPKTGTNVQRRSSSSAPPRRQSFVYTAVHRREEHYLFKQVGDKKQYHRGERKGSQNMNPRRPPAARRMTRSPPSVVSRRQETRPLQGEGEMSVDEQPFVARNTAAGRALRPSEARPRQTTGHRGVARPPGTSIFSERRPSGEHARNFMPQS